MAVLERRPRNINDEADNGQDTTDSGAANTVVAANPDRIAFSICNPSNREIWVRLMPASEDPSAKVGICLDRSGGQWSMSGSNIYTGEISVISDSGNNKEYGYIEY